MSRILIWKKTAPGDEYDIFNSTDYSELYEHVKTDWGGVCKNWGNRLWFQGIYSALDTGENEYEFITDSIDIEYINSSYDKIVLPMANIFYHGFLDSIKELATIFEKIKIPTYVVVCGVQADSYDALNEVISSIGKESARFIRAIYNTGGEFALRGYFTKEFFDRLGFHSAVVTGCPSLYQLGSDFSVNDTKKSKLWPVFNGHLKPYEKLLNMFPKSTFIDQDEFFFPLFQNDYVDERDMKFLYEFVNNYGMNAASLLSEGRIVVAADMNDWSNYIKKNDFNFAFGSRIHGTIMALLSGIPATIVVNDSRTREMAEFFHIPYIKRNPSHVFNEKEFMDIYSEMDYSDFNHAFAKNFSIYENFLKDNGIVSHVNVNNRFFFEKDPVVYNGTLLQREKFNMLASIIEKNTFQLKVGNIIFQVRKRII